MVNVSKRPLPERTVKKLEGQLAKTLGSLSADQARDFYQSFFTDSEQIVFIKRLAIIFMLEESVSYQRIAGVLNVSPSTVQRINENKSSGQYEDFTKLFVTKKSQSKFWKIIKILAEENVHHYSGGNSLKWLRRINEEL